MDVLRPGTLDEALRLRAERPDAVPIQGGTDVMVAVNLGRLRPPAFMCLDRVPELRGWSRSDGELRLGSALTYVELLDPPLRDALPALAEAARAVGSPQVRNRGTIGGNLALGSHAGDTIPPLVVEDARVQLASVRGSRGLPVADLVTGRNGTALAPDELIVAVHLRPSGARQTFMKIGRRTAMTRAVVSLAVAADVERGELRAAFGAVGPAVGRVDGSLDDVSSFPQRVVATAQPVDDIRGTAGYRRHALRVLTARAVERCLS